VGAKSQYLMGVSHTPPKFAPAPHQIFIFSSSTSQSWHHHPSPPLKTSPGMKLTLLKKEATAFFFYQYFFRLLLKFFSIAVNILLLKYRANHSINTTFRKILTSKFFRNYEASFSL
jgi:hypothetical protein